ncbi:hypothetical protein HZI65_00955 [Haemophilus haemolyticus]|uniref:Transposase IS200-like domain-containing protein n=2 Tax=Haemophilus TaxID=724 RepID=A0A502JT23_HAEHA|nr:hypothetical protein F2S80_01900 [Haemophilus seminalis]NYA24637.1 hypothetical protein [Haemophilus haemolyticus]TPH00261.1 hypothetical protein EUX54_05080 [Haemophilus haemolyticus]TPH02153.1 hypothetical protein EUX55_00960 [Haemophilus haemolyticus]
MIEVCIMPDHIHMFFALFKGR